MTTRMSLFGVTILSTLGVLAGCSASVRVAGPPVYVPPPPPAVYVAPAAEVAVQVNEAPPPLPAYDQPPIPGDGYLWTPGYWAWAAGGYYWVPGTWVLPPRVGVLWTPGYWGFVGGVYAFHAGYWGPHIGFYGGVNYGFGYVGVGFAGGRWVGGSFAYNRSVTNITNVTIVHNTYNETVVNNVTVNRVSFNGAGGTVVVPTAQERMAMQEPHVPPTALQQQHVQEAARNPALFAHANGGHPAIAATARPAEFHGPGVIAAHGSVSVAAHPAVEATARPTPPSAANNGQAARGGTPANKFQNTAAKKPLIASNQMPPNKGKNPVNKAKTAKKLPKPAPKDEPAH